MNTRLLRLLRARRGLLRLLRERPISGAALSVLVHVLVVVLVFWLGLPVTNRVNARRGEPLFVELPQIQEPAPRGDPAARERAPAAPPEPARPTPPAPPRVRAAPPAPKSAPAPPRPPAPPRVATAPPPPRQETARPAEPPSLPQPKAAPAPPPSGPPQEQAVTPKPPTSAPSTPPVTPSAPAAPSAPPGGPAVAALPRDGGPDRGALPDMRSALRRGGAGGGTSDGRGGIEGEPIPLDSPDPKYSDYLDRVRRMIKDKWIYPCIANPATRQCEYKSAHLEIEFGIGKDGRVPFVIVRQPSVYGIYDEYAVNAIKLASPFPPVPDEMSKKGIPILARFNYILESYSLTNMLR